MDLNVGTHIESDVSWENLSIVSQKGNLPRVIVYKNIANNTLDLTLPARVSNNPTFSDFASALKNNLQKTKIW